MILPEEIVNKEFARAKRGYDIDEVEDYIALLLEKYDALCRENMELEKNLKSVLTVLENKKKGDTAANELIEAAKKESERIIAEAVAKAGQIAAVSAASTTSTASTASTGFTASEENYEDVAELEEIRAQILESRREYARLREEIDSYKLKLFDMYSQHITLIEQIPLPDLERLGATDGGIGTAKKSQNADTVRNQIKVAEAGEKKTVREAEVKRPATFSNKPAVKPAVKPAAKPAGDAPHSTDAESSAKFGLNIVREPLKARPGEEGISNTAASNQAGAVFPLQFMESEGDKKKKW